MEEVIKDWVLKMAVAIEGAAAVIVVIACVRALYRALGILLRRRTGLASDSIRLGLGRWLTLALEFEVAADILLTAVAPTWNELGRLAAIIALRTVLTYTLQKEISRAEASGELSEPTMRDPSNRPRMETKWRGEVPPAPPEARH